MVLKMKITSRTIARDHAMTAEKKCTKCKRFKDFNEYYFSRGRYRSECKSCTIRLVVKSARKKKRQLRQETTNYRIEYYANNREKFAEYRRRFKERHPNYYREYKYKIINK